MNELQLVSDIRDDLGTLSNDIVSRLPLEQSKYENTDTLSTLLDVKQLLFQVVKKLSSVKSKVVK